MGSKVISFRLDDDKLALLQQYRLKGESESQAAMRLLLGVLGIEGKQSIHTVDIVDIVDTIRSEIADSLADGNIKEAIASSYAAVMGQFNGLVSEVEALKSQLQELQLTPPSPVPDDQLPIPCSQLPVTNDQLPVTNDQLPNDKIPDPTRSQIQNIRTTLDRKNIKVSATQIRKAFVDAGWNGHNYQETRKAVIEILGGDKK